MGQLVLLWLISQHSTQMPTQLKAQDTTTTTVPLSIESRVEVPLSEPFLTLPVLCGPEGRIFVRMATASGVADLVAISHDGKSITPFNSFKLTDITNPVVKKFFVNDSDVYELVLGSITGNDVVELKQPGGEIQKQRKQTGSLFIARFKHDGTYIGAIGLEMPFSVQQIGAFRNDTFLIAGEDLPTHEPKIALVGSDGRFKRYIELHGDIQLGGRVDSERGSTTGQGEKVPLVGGHFGDGLTEVLRTSSIIQDGSSLLLIRKNHNIPIFSISASGEVHAIVPDVPSGFSLWDLKTTDSMWIAVYARRLSGNQGLEFQIYALDRNTGRVIEHYSLPKFLGLGLACATDQGKELTFLNRDNDKLILTRITATRTGAQEAPKAPN
jgi:hypothetical protein